MNRQRHTKRGDTTYTDSSEDNKQFQIGSGLSNTFSLHACAVVAAATLLLSACEEPGTAGGGFLDDGANLQTRTAPVGQVESYSADPVYTGSLTYLPLGRYDDELFGAYTSVGVIRPDIGGNIESIGEEDELSLQLVFSQIMYGDTTSTTDFEIYPLEEPWRGNELKFGQELAYDESRPVASFSVTGNEKVIVPLDREWVEEYAVWLASEDEDRFTRYRSEFHGLAIVPADESSKVLFGRARIGSGSGMTDQERNENQVRFILDVAGEGDEEDERYYIPPTDWGALLSRGEAAGGDSPSGEQEPVMAVNNSLDQMVTFLPGLDDELFESRNLASVMLKVHPDENLLGSTLPSGHVRPEVSYLRIHLVDPDAESVSNYIFSRGAQFEGLYNEDDNSYRFDLTNYANSLLFSNQNQSEFYLSAETINGIIFTTWLHGPDAPEELRPRILITSVNTNTE